MNHSTSRAPWGLLGMFALLALGDWVFARREIDVLLPEQWDWRRGGVVARSREVVGAGVLCFGDSLMKAGVLPTVIEARTGLPAFNLAVPMGQPASSYFLLRRALRAGARPKLILIDAAPFLLRMNPDDPRVLRAWTELLSQAERFDLAWSTRDPILWARITLNGAAPILRARQDLRAAVLAWGRGDLVAGRQRFQAAQFTRNQRVNRGANAMRAVPNLGFDLTDNARWLFQAFACHPVNASYLDRFLDLAAGRGIPVVFVLTPPAPGAQKFSDGNGFAAAHDVFARSLRARHPGLTVADARRSGYPPELFFLDPIHLNHRGATALTDDLTPVFARLLTGESADWVTLPPYADRRRAIDVEDLDESALAIIGGAARRR